MGLLDLPDEAVPKILAYLMYQLCMQPDGRRASSNNNAWKIHASSIATFILSRSIECYLEASQLEKVKAQRYYDLHGYEAIMARYKRIYLAAQAVSAVYRRFQATGSGSSMTLHISSQETPDNRKASKRAIYWFWRYSHAGYNGTPRLELRAPRDKAALADLHQWLQSDWRAFGMNDYTWLYAAAVISSRKREDTKPV